MEQTGSRRSSTARVPPPELRRLLALRRLPPSAGQPPLLAAISLQRPLPPACLPSFGLTTPFPLPPPRALALQERAYVTGLSAANLVVSKLGVGAPANILGVEPDEPHIAAGRAAVRALRQGADALGVRSPFL